MTLSSREWKRLLDAKEFAQLDQILATATPSIEMLTDESFDAKVLRVLGPVLVFVGTGAVPGDHRLGAALEQLMLTTQRKVYRMTVPGSDAMRTRFATPALPQLSLFRKGRLHGLYRGEFAAEQIDAWIRDYGY